MSTQRHKQKIWNMISDIEVPMLVTQDAQGVLTGRPMQIVQDSYDGTLWFFAHDDADFVRDIKHQPQVAVCFAEPKERTYVSLRGQAKISEDAQKKQELWSDDVAIWFPEGQQSSDCVMLEIKINHGEHWVSNMSDLGYQTEVRQAKQEDRMPEVGRHQIF